MKIDSAQVKEDMSQCIVIFKNIILETGDEWGNVDYNVVCFALRTVIESFENVGYNQDAMKPVIVMHSKPGMDCPMCCGNGEQDVIFLHTQNNFWSQYIYQFSHEYCHHVIAGPLDGSLVSSFWFEESICELASCYFMEKVVEIWMNSPDTPQNLKLFVPSQLKYFCDHLRDIPDITVPLNEWLLSNLGILQDPKYHRDLYQIIAKSLFGLFKEHPRLWLLLPYFKRVAPEEYISFDNWLKNVVGPKVPDNLSNEYKILINTLI